MELRVEGGWVHHSSHMSVLCHSYGWLGGGMDRVADGKDRLIACREMPEHFQCATRGHR